MAEKEGLVAEVIVEDEAWGFVAGMVEECFETVTTSEIEGLRLGEVSLLFTGDAQIQKLNATFRGKDKPTNVLSFPAGAPLPGMPAEALAAIGDIALARETCEREAVEKGIALEDHAAHLVIHGLLHLFGYTHEEETDAAKMEALEIKLLKKMAIGNPYAEKED